MTCGIVSMSMIPQAHWPDVAMLILLSLVLAVFVVVLLAFVQTLRRSPMKASFVLSFTITEPVAPITLAKTAFAGVVGTAITDSTGEAGGTPPLTMAVNDPATLPPGVTVGTDGSVSGTPTAAGTFSVPVTVTDAQG